MDTQILHLKLNATPAKIREWFSSEDVVNAVESIGDHFTIPDNMRSIIPRLLLRLEIQDIEPQYFTAELANKLKIDSTRAKMISKEISRLILAPVKRDFASSGTNIDRLDEFEVPIVKPAPMKPVMLSPEAPKQPIIGVSKDTEKSSANAAPEKITSVPMPVPTQNTPPEMPPVPAIPPKITAQPIRLSITEKEISKPLVALPKTVSAGFPVPTAKPSVVPQAPITGTMPQFPKPAGPIGASLPQAPTTPLAPKPPAPSPVILHRETAIAPTTTNTPVIHSGNLVSKNLIENKSKFAAPPSPPPKIRLEFASEDKSKLENKEGLKPQKKPKPKIVNYTAQSTMPPPMPPAPVTAPAQETQGTKITAPSAISPLPQKPHTPSPVSAPTVPPKTYALPQVNVVSAPAVPPLVNRNVIPEKPIPHTLDLSSKPPPPPPPNLPI